jgi:hypothetical protein
MIQESSALDDCQQADSASLGWRATCMRGERMWAGECAPVWGHGGLRALYLRNELRTHC